MNLIIIDDELPAIKILSQFAAKIAYLNIRAATTNPFEALELLSKEKIDLILTDIEMPDLSGVALVRSLEQKPMVIFTTAYENYALEGYELDIVDYLVKPIRFERFLKAINKAHKLYNLNHQFATKTKVEYLTIKVEYKTVKIDFNEILYIEGLKDYVKIFTTKEMYLTRLNLKGIVSKLPNPNFLRIHRSYIAALSKIESFQKSQVVIDNKTLPIGDSYRDALLKILNK